MSRILFSTNIKWFDEVLGMYDENFKRAYVYNKDFIHAAIYKKLNINSENYYFEGEDWIFTSGTMIYKSKLGVDALKELLNDARRLPDISSLRKNIIGSYAIMLKVGDKCYIFVDETHTYFLYYYYSVEGVIITNSYWHIAKVCRLALDSYAALEKGVRGCIMCNETPISNVKKICASECIEIDCISGKFNILPIKLNNYSKQFSTREQAVDSLYEAVKEISSIRSQCIHDVRHFFTGGIDSRLELAIYLYNNDNITLSYWIGRDLLTNGTTEDAKIVENVAKEYAIKSEIIDVSEDYFDTLNSINIQKANKYGEDLGLYGGNYKLFSFFENKIYESSVGFGYLGETMRPLSELDSSYRNNYSLDDFVKDVFCRTGLEKEIFHLPHFYEYVGKQLSSLLDKIGLDSKNLSKDSLFKLFSFSRFEADCTMSNFSNLFTYTFPIFGQKKVADIIYSIPCEWFDDDFISIRLIEKFQPQLLKYPIYSHHRRFIYDKNHHIMIESIKYKFLDFMKKHFKNTFIYKDIYLKWAHKYVRPNSAKNEELVKICSKEASSLSILRESDIMYDKDFQWNGVDIGTIASFVSDMKVLNFIQEEKDVQSR